MDLIRAKLQAFLLLYLQKWLLSAPFARKREIEEDDEEREREDAERNGL
jgi:hypothetical protein